MWVNHNDTGAYWRPEMISCCLMSHATRSDAACGHAVAYTLTRTFIVLAYLYDVSPTISGMSEQIEMDELRGGKPPATASESQPGLLPSPNDDSRDATAASWSWFSGSMFV